ncbi:MAG: DUF5611 family protein [Euryarchaeota archaeon]|nr:DUF5611 family protein [Euryarchaeota archaeon]
MKFDIKRGHGSSLEGDGLRKLMQDILGPVKEKDDGTLVTSFGATTQFEVKMLSKTVLSVVSESDKKASPEAMGESSKKYNKFMEAATGFNSKERTKRLKKKAKDGKL